MGALAVLAGGIVAAQESGEAVSRDYSGLSGDANRGFYVARVAGCVTCHRAADESGSLFSGGLPIESRAGTYVVPNITPHPEDGIG
ncbi:MAG: cytochrome C, partial [Gammaproteobacteria bacterium]|nr:cytochrome C [Gammaproteobacteria bacterium]